MYDCPSDFFLYSCMFVSSNTKINNWYESSQKKSLKFLIIPCQQVIFDGRAYKNKDHGIYSLIQKHYEKKWMKTNCQVE